MREISFRGKRTDNGEWVYGYPYETYRNCHLRKLIALPPDELGRGEYIEVIPETIGQYTGLTDKNGKKIFEGDILEFSDRLVSVFWHAHLGCWDSNFLKYTNQDNEKEDMSPYRWKYRAEVVGNIHDNSEPLKGGEQK